MKTVLLFKSDVKINGARPELLRALATAVEIWEQCGVPELVVTSINDGQHMKLSKHYRGEAMDLRTHNVREEGRDPEILRAHLAASLGKDYDVILEFTNTEREHLHVEFDPKVSNEAKQNG